MTLYSVKKDLENLESILETAQANHDNLTELRYYDEYIYLKRVYLAMLVSSLSSGTMASIIGTGYYININYANNAAIQYIYGTDPDNIAQIDINTDVFNLVKECYTGERTIESGE